MKYYLFTGAGFSKNYGFPLANDFFALLLGDKDIQKSERMKEVLWENYKKDFEYALDQIKKEVEQNNDAAIKNYKTLQGAIRKIFDKYNIAFDSCACPTLAKVIEFLNKFDGIFTVNQDLLIEYQFYQLEDFIHPGLKPNIWFNCIK